MTCSRMQNILNGPLSGDGPARIGNPRIILIASPGSRYLGRRGTASTAGSFQSERGASRITENLRLAITTVCQMDRFADAVDRACHNQRNTVLRCRTGCNLPHARRSFTDIPVAFMHATNQAGYHR